MTGSRAARMTGVAHCDAGGVVLKPYYGLSMRTRWIMSAVALLAGAVVLALSLRLAPPLLMVGVTVAVLLLVRATSLLVQVTLIALADAPGILRERRLVGLPLRWTRLWIPYRDIREVRLVVARNPSRPGMLQLFFNRDAAVTVTCIVVQGPGGSRVAWYTKYDDSAEAIARRLAEFAGCPLRDERGLETGG